MHSNCKIVKAKQFWKSINKKQKSKHSLLFFVCKENFEEENYFSLQQQSFPQSFELDLLFEEFVFWFEFLFDALLFALLFLFCSIITPLLNWARVVFA